VHHTRATRSKLASSTELTSISTTALPSKVGNNKIAATRKRAALGDVTNAHKKSAPLGDITNAVLKKETIEKPPAPVKRPLSRKPSSATVKRAAPAPTTTTTTVTMTTTTIVESKPLAPKQNAQITGGASVVIPKKRPSEAVAPTKRIYENVPPRRTLQQSTSSTSLAQRGPVRTTSRRRAEEAPEPEVPRKKQKVEPVQDWDDLDAADVNDPFMVSEYVNEIFDYMRELEVSPPSSSEKLTFHRSKQCRILST
jgi:G2/mitotic-specific cyclin 2